MVVPMETAIRKGEEMAAGIVSQEGIGQHVVVALAASCADRVERTGSGRSVDGVDGVDAESVAADVLRRLGEGDAATWAAVTKEYGPRLCAVGRSCRLTPQEVEDAQQRTWSSLWAHVSRIREPDRLGAWLVTAMRRECLSALRGRRDELVGDWNPLEHAYSRNAPPSCGDPQEHLNALEDRRLAGEIWLLVEELPPRQRDLLRALYAVDELTYAEISVRTGLPVGAIGPTRQRALRRLRELAERRRLGVVA
jgi:RNA polymerase sigma factor (sigma-70 family)